MSHMVEVSGVEIRDLDALAKAAEACGMELVQGATTFKWYGRFMNDSPIPAGFKPEDYGKCEHALRVKGANSMTYEIGVVRRRDGKPGYQLLWDAWQGGYGLEAAAGARLSKLLPQYSLAVARKPLARQGYRVQGVTVRQDGSLHVELER